MAKTTTLLSKVQAGAQSLSSQSPTGQPPVQQLSAQKGLTQVPLTAYGTSLIGGSPQQAKMAGVPAQKKAAFAPQGETQLEQAQALETTTETAQDRAQKDLAAKYTAALGTYGAKITDWINSAKQKITGQTAVAQVDISDQILVGLDTGKKAEAIDLIRQAATTIDPAKKNQIELQLNAVLGRTANNPLSDAEKAQLYQDVSSSIQTAVTAGQTAVTGADRKITLSDISTLGSTPEELADLLKVPVEEVNNYSLAQLKNRIDQVSNEQFGQAKTALAGLTSGALSPADRAALRQYLRGIESIGVAGTETGIANLVDQIDKSNTVQFSGKAFAVDELLASPALNDLFKTVLDEMGTAAGTGPNVEQLKKTEPDMYNWLVKNKDSVQGLINQSLASSKSFGQLQKANIATLGPLAEYQPDLIKKWGYDKATLRAEAIDPSSLPPVFSTLAKLPKEKQEVASATLAQIENAAPGQIVGLTSDEIAALDLLNAEGPAAKYIRAADAQQKVKALTDPAAVLSAYSIGDESIEDINDALSGDNLAVALGIEAGNASDLDVDHDGKFTEVDANVLKDKMSATLPSLKNIAQGGKLPQTQETYSLKRVQPAGESGAVYSALRTFTKDGNINPDEVIGLSQLEVNPDILDDLSKKPPANIPGGDQIPGALAQAATRAAYNEANSMLRNKADISLDNLDQLLNINTTPIWADEAIASIQQLSETIDKIKSAAPWLRSQKSRDILNSYLNQLTDKKNILQSGFEGVGVYAQRPSPSSGGRSSSDISLPETRTGKPLFDVDVGRTVQEKLGSAMKTLKKIRW